MLSFWAGAATGTSLVWVVVAMFVGGMGRKWAECLMTEWKASDQIASEKKQR
jgi:hypothetical protein